MKEHLQFPDPTLHGNSRPNSFVPAIATNTNRPADADNGNPVAEMQITTKRLRLREFVCDDWFDVLAYHGDHRYLRYYTWSQRTESDAREFVGMFLEQQQEQPRRRFQLVITRLHDGRLIGNCGLRRKPDNDWEADIGYELSPDYWGQGFATEAAGAMVEFGLRDLGLHRISSWCIAGNTASARALERLGFRQEGRLRQNEYFKGRWWDTLLYALLADEWRPAP